MQLDLLRDGISLAGHEFTVAGVLRETGGQEDRMAFVRLAEAQRLLGQPGALSLIEVSALCHGCPIEDIVAQIAARLPHARVSAVQQAVKARLDTVERLSRFSVLMTAAMALVGALMIFITMMAAVTERTREIGVLRALGYRKAHVMRIFVLEAALVSVAGGVLGWAAGLLSGAAAGRQLAALAAGQVSPALALYAVGGAAMVGIASSLYPAWRASRLDPAEALRYF